MSENKNFAFNLPTVDELFDATHGSYLGRIENIPTNVIKAFKDHPFKVKDDEEMERLVQSIKERGVLNSILVRPKENGEFEIVSGHRRKRAVELANLKETPCMVRKLTDEEATIIMVDSNLQREEILPSEKGFAYKMKMEALNRQGARNDLTSTPLVSKLRTNEEIGKEQGDSREQVRRYIRLTELIPELLQMVDEKKVAFRPAVELSYLTEEEQYVLLDAIQYTEATPSLAQAISLKRRSQEKTLTAERIDEIMEQEKPNQIPKLKISKDKLEDLLPDSLKTQEQIEDYIIKCVQEYTKRQKQKNEIAR